MATNWQPIGNHGYNTDTYIDDKVGTNERKRL